MSTTTRVNLISLLALLFLVLVLAVTPETRQLIARMAFWIEGVEEKLEARRERPPAAADDAGTEPQDEGREVEEDKPEMRLPAHVTFGPNGELFPEPGYKWINDDPDDMQVEWCPGCVHPQHPHVIASDEPDQWHAAPGYDWAEAKGVNDMRVVWVPGKRHSAEHEHVVAAEKEGEWQPAPGYKWVNEDPHDLSVAPDASDTSVTPPGE